MQSGRAERRDTLMDKAILLAVAASVCTATASLCQRKGARDNETAGQPDQEPGVKARRLVIPGALALA